MQVELDGGAGLGTALKWVRRVLYLTEFTADEAKISVQKLLAEVPAQIRSGGTMARKIMGELDFDGPRANSVQESPLRQQPLLTALLAKLGDAEGAKSVVADLGRVRAELTKPSNMRVFVSGNLTRLPAP